MLLDWHNLILGKWLFYQRQSTDLLKWHDILHSSRKRILKLTWNHNTSQIAKELLSKITPVRGIEISDLKLNYRTLVKMTAWYCPQICLEQWNIIEDPERNQYSHNQVTFENCIKSYIKEGGGEREGGERGRGKEVKGKRERERKLGEREREREEHSRIPLPPPSLTNQCSRKTKYPFQKEFSFISNEYTNIHSKWIKNLDIDPKRLESMLKVLKDKHK